MRLNSVKFKICILYVGIISISIILFRTVAYINLRRTLFQQVDHQLMIKAQEIGDIVKHYLVAVGDNEEGFVFAVKRAILLEGEHPQQDKIKEQEFQWMMRVNKFDLDKDYINFLGPSGDSMVRTYNMNEKILRGFMKTTDGWKDKNNFENLNLKNENLNLRVISVPFSYNAYQHYMIQVGTSLEPTFMILKQRWGYNVISFFLIMFVAVLAAWVIVGQILKPVMEIARTAKNISLENLSARVKIEHADEEMKYLADAFNGMIARLEESFQYITQFSTYVSHELKTPLAIIKGEAEYVLKQERNAKEYKKVVSITLEEVERMLKTVSDLLLLAKLEYWQEVIKFEKVDFTELFTEIAEQAKILASLKDIEVHSDVPQAPIGVNGNKLHLRRLFLNLVDNAIKFTPKKGKITMFVKCENAKVIASISDTGIGIVEEDLPKLFKKFFTVGSKDQGEVIHGLGLNIVQHIIKIHHGDILVKSEIKKGSTFTVTLPLL